ncbi:MAG: glucose-6-phosphate dehydrogenase [Vicinamibacterales bacterium]|nr:glucose-6-phosphate dehydrogenase [Vicinamibacterales bacterium]
MTAGPCTLVILGVAGDLTRRLLMPALYHLAVDGLLPDAFRIVGYARTEVTEDELRARLREGIVAQVSSALDESRLDWLVSRVTYVQGAFEDEAGFDRLAAHLATLDQDAADGGHHLYYLATAPEFFEGVCRQLGDRGLLDESGGAWRRVIVEKPFGRDLASARALNAALASVMDESQVYRIDHYLGKETVQNILVFRFGNGIFEPIWNRRYVDHVQITVAESVGVETRGGYYDETGALRDMVPNHLFQLLTLVGMEPPSSFQPAALHDEQAKLLQAVMPIEPSACGVNTVRAQYAAGRLDGESVPGYLDEARVDAGSGTETYAALTLAVDNWRWAGVPFYLRTGKRLAAKRTEVVIQFRRAPLALFRQSDVAAPSANQLVLSIQPEESISLEFAAKVPGPEVTTAPVRMRFCYEEHFKIGGRTGYETLLYDAMTGDRSLFKRADVIEAGWALVDPMLQAWEANACSLVTYPAGTDGPAEADALLGRDGRRWRPV